jgi:hypothetical protein
MLRALVVLLLLANGLYFAWTKGWLGAPPRHAEREPQRLAEQVSPEAVTVLPPKGASAALQAARDAARVCLETAPLPPAQLGTAELSLREALVPADAVQREAVSEKGPWIVFGGRYPDAGPRSAREDELRRLGLSFERLNSPPELAPGFVLSRHDTRDAAEAWLAEKAPRTLKGARVASSPGRGEGTVLRVPRAAPEQAEKLAAAGFKPCETAR